VHEDDEDQQDDLAEGRTTSSGLRSVPVVRYVCTDPDA